MPRVPARDAGHSYVSRPVASDGVEKSGTSQPPSYLWYLAAFMAGSIAWMVGVTVAGSAWDIVRDASISSSNQALDAQGQSIAVFTDVPQANRSIECRLISVINDESQPMTPYDSRVVQQLPVEDDGKTWYLIAFEQDGLDGVTATCAPKDGGVDNAQYAVAVVDGYRKRNLTGLAIMAGGIVVASVLATVTFIRRRKHRLA